jgi:hypothetical protein
MLRSVEATIDEQGHVSLSEPVTVSRPTRAIVTILDESVDSSLEPLILAESSLEDWLTPEEDEAWKHLADLPDLDAPADEAKR